MLMSQWPGASSTARSGGRSLLDHISCQMKGREGGESRKGLVIGVVNSALSATWSAEYDVHLLCQCIQFDPVYLVS